MKEYIVRVQQTKEYVFTMAAENEADAWENAKEAFYDNDAEETWSRLTVADIKEKEEQDGQEM